MREKNLTHILQLCTGGALVLGGLFGTLAGTPAQGAADKTPGMIVIDHVAKQYGPVSFDHATHVTLAGNCGTCHHEHNDKMVAVCKECHTLNTSAMKAGVKQGFVPCSACHTEYSPETPGMPDLKVALHKKCFQCHVGIAGLGTSPGGCTQLCHSKR